jgi:Leu/Phe-tRNA-protein transferase
MPTDEVTPDSDHIRPGINEMLSRYHSGWYPCFMGEEPTGPVGWRKYTHRGIQWLDKLHVGKRQKSYVFAERFEVKFDTAFDETVRGCAETVREGNTWITPHLVELYSQLHDMGPRRFPSGNSKRSFARCDNCLPHSRMTSPFQPSRWQ